MIGAEELLSATQDSIAVTEETGQDGGAALRAAGFDPIDTARTAALAVESYYGQIERLQVEHGYDYRKALLSVMATVWCEGAIAGKRAGDLVRVEDE